MKTATIPITSKFSLLFLKNSFLRLSAIAAITTALLGSTFSTANAQDPHPGEAIFKLKCTMCHGQNGEGIAVFPPLAESEWVNGPAENLIRIQLRGLTGPITVKGKEYNAMMPANAAMSDQDIADVLSYVRSSMGNKAPAVTPDMVKAIRAEEEGNVTPLEVKDLKPLVAAEEDKPEPETAPVPVPEPAVPEVKPTEPEMEPSVESQVEPKTPLETDEGGAGKALFKLKCALCHGQNGEGLAIFPPLDGSEWVSGPAENLIKIQLHGLKGPIEVKGKIYDGMMPNNALMTDQEIADVLTYVRTSMGDNASAITADMVKEYRPEAIANPDPITVKDLKDPYTKPETALSGPTELASFKPAQSNGSGSVILWTLGIIGVCTLPVAAGLIKN